MVTTVKPTPAQERAYAKFLDDVGGNAFRRQDIADVLYNTCRPRHSSVAASLADVFLRRLQASGKLVKAGHVHWRIELQTERKLRSGRTVTEHTEVKRLDLSTRCPSKWVAVDLETGEVFEGSADGWKRAGEGASAEAAAILGKQAPEKPSKAGGVSRRVRVPVRIAQQEKETSGSFVGTDNVQD